MADDNGSGIDALLGAVIGVLFIAVLALGFVVLNTGAERQTADMIIEAPAAPRPG